MSQYEYVVVKGSCNGIVTVIIIIIIIIIIIATII